MCLAFEVHPAAKVDVFDSTEGQLTSTYLLAILHVALGQQLFVLSLSKDLINSRLHSVASLRIE